MILEKGKITARELSEFLGLEANTSGTRLFSIKRGL